jgi:hypothetical protein
VHFQTDAQMIRKHWSSVTIAEPQGCQGFVSAVHGEKVCRSK